MSLFLSCCVYARLYVSSNCDCWFLWYDMFGDLIILIPPRAMSLKRMWNPWNDEPTTMKMAYGTSGYSLAMNKLGSRRNDVAAFSRWKKLVFSTAVLNSRQHCRMT
eukprot:gene2752-biopygen2716